MEFFVDFDLAVPQGIADSEVRQRQAAEATAAAGLAAAGHLRRVWRRPTATGAGTVVGLYEASTASELDELLHTLPLYDWMRITVTPLSQHPNDPAAMSVESATARSGHATVDLPAPHLTLVYRLEATAG